MQNLKALFLFFSMLLAGLLQAQNDESILEYINAYKEIAISEMQRTGVPAAIKLAQGIHETDAGRSVLVRKSNNHFGIKCKTNWTGQSVKHTDDAPNECFRKYDSPLESYIDHSDFLKTSQRYAALFRLDPTDFEAWAYGLKKAGYATNPKYPQVIIRLIKEYNLQDYTLIAMGKFKPVETIVTTSETIMTPADEKEALVRFTDTKKASGHGSLTTTTEPKEETTLFVEKTYPTGEFKINETRVIWARKGTSFLSIAEKHSLPLMRIFEFNDMDVQDFVEKDQLVFLQRKRRTGNAEQHVVKEGETLHDIAQSQAIRIESLMEYNHLRPGMHPRAGAILYLRSTAPSKPALATGNQ